MKRLSGLWTLTLLLPLAGCGLGTEVGNGAKPDDDDSDKNVAADAASPDGSVDPVADKASDLPTDQQGSIAGGVDSNEGGPESPAGFTVSPSFLFARCASPFSEDYGSNYRLQTADSGEGLQNVLQVSRTGSAPWQVKLDNDDLLYTVVKDISVGTLGVKTKDANGKDVDDLGFKCTGVTTKKNVEIDGHPGKVKQVTVFIGNDKLKAQVTWWFTEAVPPTKAELIRIEVDDVDGEVDPVRLDATIATP